VGETAKAAQLLKVGMRDIETDRNVLDGSGGAGWLLQWLWNFRIDWWKHRHR
jgi:hypothetical protein